MSGPTDDEAQMQAEITGLLDRIEELLSQVRDSVTEESGDEGDDTGG